MSRTDVVRAAMVQAMKAKDKARKIPFPFVICFKECRDR